MDLENVRRLPSRGRARQVVEAAIFHQDLGAYSLDLIELTMMLEERLEIALGDQESEGCLTVGHAMRLLDRKCPNAAARPPEPQTRSPALIMKSPNRSPGVRSRA